MVQTHLGSKEKGWASLVSKLMSYGGSYGELEGKQDELACKVSMKASFLRASLSKKWEWASFQLSIPPFHSKMALQKYTKALESSPWSPFPLKNSTRRLTKLISRRVWERSKFEISQNFCRFLLFLTFSCFYKIKETLGSLKTCLDCYLSIFSKIEYFT